MPISGVLASKVVASNVWACFCHRSRKNQQCPSRVTTTQALDERHISRLKGQREARVAAAAASAAASRDGLDAGGGGDEDFIPLDGKVREKDTGRTRALAASPRASSFELDSSGFTPDRHGCLLRPARRIGRSRRDLKGDPLT